MMPRTFKINEKQIEEIVKMRKTNTNKRIDKRLWAIELRGKGMKNPEISEKLGTSAKVVSRWMSAYCKAGMEALLSDKFGGNHRNISFKDEEQFLREFDTRAKNGQLIETTEIKQAYENLVGHSIGGSQIYRVLHRHGWHKVMLQSKHPNKTSDEAVEASKKLTFEWKI
jgi:transposase